VVVVVAGEAQRRLHEAVGRTASSSG